MKSNNLYSKKYQNKFQPYIIKRGIDYYDTNKIISCYKTTNGFTSVVKGNYGSKYIVNITEKNDVITTMECSCPYNDNCKHEYATLIAIDEGLYQSKELLTTFKVVKNNLSSIIDDIPAKKLKSYIINQLNNDSLNLDMVSFNKEFIDYIPLKTYDYYLNTLYNSIILNINTEEIINNYLLELKDYVEKENYNQVFVISRAIINCYKNITDINVDNIFNSIFPTLGIYLRLCLINQDKTLKSDIKKLIKDLKKNNYYNNKCLEIMIAFINEN